MKENTILKAIMALILIGILALGGLSLYSAFDDLNQETPIDQGDDITIVIDEDPVETDQEDENYCPVLAEIADMDIKEGSTLIIEASALDIDGDNVTYTFDGISGADISDNKLVWNTDSGDSGDYTITITASDGECETTSSFDVEVTDSDDDDEDDEDVNVCPVITASDITADEGTLVSSTVTVTDEDSDSFTITYSTPLDSNGQWQTTLADAGVYTAYAYADDGECTSEDSFTITINDMGDEPTDPTDPTDPTEPTESDLADLKVDSITANGFDQDGNITYTVTLENDSLVDVTEPFNVETHFTAGGIDLYETREVTDLTADLEYSFDGNDILSAFRSYSETELLTSFSVSVDTANSIEEADETNNQMTYQETLYAENYFSPYELVITNVEHTGFTAENVGSSYTITVENRGSQDVETPFTVKGQLFIDSLVTADSMTIPSLGAGETRELDMTISIQGIMGTEDEMTVVFYATVDYDSDVTELDETNNLYSLSDTWTAVDDFNRDISIDSMTVTREGISEKTLVFTAEVTNNGYIDVEDVDIYTTFTIEDMLAGKFQSTTISEIGAGETVEIEYSVNLSTLRGVGFNPYALTNFVGKDCAFTITADNSELISETDETNNFGSMQGTIYPWLWKLSYINSL
tara:strand:- start:86 stop:2008 length:1923 start_codon:yes stop_codon:yes gene_type:complete